MDAELLELIRRSNVNDKTYTHESYFGPAEKWHIKNNELSSFWQEYCRLAYKETQGKNLKLCVGEKISDCVPVIVKGCLEFSTENYEPYKDDFILSVVYCYQQALMELFEYSDTYQELVCCVLEPDNDMIDDGIVKSYFVLQFPYCKIESALQTRILRPRVLQILRKENIVAKLKQTPINDWEKILDANVMNETWPLYRSVKHPDAPELLITHIYKKIEKEDIEKATRGDELEDVEWDLSEVFNPACHIVVDQGLLPGSLFAGECDHVYWLPLFLSIGYWNKITVPKINISPMMSKDVTLTKSSTNSFYSTGATTHEETPMEIIDRLLPLLSRERVETDHFWIDVGKALYTTDPTENGLKAWIRFTERSDAHSAEECRSMFGKFGNDNCLTLKTIAWYARTDSPEAYQKWHLEWCRSAMMKANSCAHTDVATALYRIYWLDFVCASLTKKKWYHYTDHRWTELDDGITLRRFISSDFRYLFEKLHADLSKQRQEASDDRDKDLLSVDLKKLETLINKVKTVHFKQSIMKEAAEFFYDSDFYGNLDTNPNLMGLFNGVLETCDFYACVRDGKPEDHISKCCNIYWNNNFTWGHPLVERCMLWMRQVFPDHNLVEYALRLFASCLRGRNSDKLFPILTGDGNNSKSMLKKLFEAAFGSYCDTLPTSLITNKRTSSSAPTPELAQAKGSRLCFIQEPDTEDSLKNGIIKELTGGDTFFARMLNDNGGKIEATFKLFFMCNKVPIIPGCDKATKNRLRIVPFLSTWSAEAPETESEQFRQRIFKMDPFFEKQIPELAPAFMWILVQKYEEYRSPNIGLNEPQIIKDHTFEYWRENDVYQQFMAESIEEVLLPGTKKPDPSAMLSITELYKEFKFWFKESFPGLKAPDRSTVKHELSQRWNRKPSRDGWAGIRLNQPVADMNSVATI